MFLVALTPGALARPPSEATTTGAALADAEGFVTTEGTSAFALFSAFNNLANGLTLAVTTAEGHPRAPNSWPGGCGSMRPAPLH